MGSHDCAETAKVRRIDGYLVRGRIASEEGTLPRNIYRYLVDGRVFQHVRRRLGGAVLIDCSGSMSLSAEDLKSILKHSPGACVAAIQVMIATACFEFWRLEAAKLTTTDCRALWRLQRHRRSCSSMVEQTAEASVLDSDGQVTGIHDRMSAINSLESTSLCKRNNNCRRIASEDADAVELLKHLNK